MIITFLLWVSNTVVRKVYKIWISSIEIILEKDTDIEVIKPSISSQKFIYPETIIMDLSRPIMIEEE
jgi:hypothetical protein